MAYQQVGTPRFYINMIEWLASTGAVPLPSSATSSNGLIANSSQLLTLPVNPTPVYSWTFNDEANSLMTGKGWTDKGFCAVLGHNMKSTVIDTIQSYFYLFTGTPGSLTKIIFGNGNDSSGNARPMINVSSGIAGTNFTPDLDGFSIAGFNGTDADYLWNVWVWNDFIPKAGSFIIGTYYDMPHSPDLNLTIEYSTGTKTFETRGGSSLSNTMWRPPMWGTSLGPWELNDPDSTTAGQVLAHSSRRSWSLSFSFLAKENTFPKYNALNTLAEEPNVVDPDQHTLTGSDDFFSQVWNRVGTALPFIFQPDKDVLEFAICKFDQKSISFQQTAPGLYSVKLKIREVW